jgi:hypothetical protein
LPNGAPLRAEASHPSRILTAAAPRTQPSAPRMLRKCYAGFTLPQYRAGPVSY